MMPILLGRADIILTLVMSIDVRNARERHGIICKRSSAPDPL